MCVPLPSAPVMCAGSSVSCGSGMVDGLKLAHLLGRGSFGAVYAGQWYGTDVAVKVRPYLVCHLYE